MKIAARWRIQRRWHIPLETDTSTFVMRIGNRNGRNQSLCVWVFWVEEQFICFGDFNDFTQIHHGHTVADMPDRRKRTGSRKKDRRLSENAEAGSVYSHDEPGFARKQAKLGLGR
jgi:hypothetical protein